MDPQRIEALAAAVDDSFERVQVPALKRLVEQPSHTYAKDDVEAAAALVDEIAREMDLEMHIHEDKSGTFAPHRVYQTAVTKDTRAPALVGHIDTVFPRSMGFLEFSREGDIVRGPGTLDMKSGLTEMFFALGALRAVDKEKYAALAVRVVVVSDEEVGSPSSRALFNEVAENTSYALVFEAGRKNDELVTCRKGAAGFTVTARGVAAHAGNKHHEGVNAINGLARLLLKLEALTDYDRGVTLNVGLIEGGTAKNTVPDFAKAVLDVRFIRAVDGEAITKEIEALCRAGVGDVTFELSGGVSRPPMEATDAIQALRTAYEPFAAAQGIGVGEAPLQGGGSDANLLASEGVPCIDGLGPEGAHFHKPEEWSNLDSLRRRTIALAAFLDAHASSTF